MCYQSETEKICNHSKRTVQTVNFKIRSVQIDPNYFQFTRKRHKKVNFNSRVGTSYVLIYKIKLMYTFYFLKKKVSLKNVFENLCSLLLV